MAITIKSAILACGLVLSPAIASDVQTRIIGGCDTDVGNHSWIAAVAYKNYGNEWQSTFCGATVIHENWAVTAAHCMYVGEARTALIPENLELFIGTRVLDSGEGQHHDVSEIHVHPSYITSTSTSTSHFHNDIALLKLSTPTTATPARLATIRAGANHDALAVGWGRRNAQQVNGVSDDYPQTLQEVNLTTYDNSVCNPGSQLQLLNSQICAGELAGGEDSCSGDSGGPLLLRSLGDDTLVGIVSYGYGCAQRGLLGVYTSVSSYLDWIAETTENPSTGVSDVPQPASYSEDFSDFDSTCNVNKGALTENPPPNNEQPSSGGGSISVYWLIVFSLALSFGRYTRPSASNKKA